MTDPTIPGDAMSLDARKASASFHIAEDGSSYECTRVFGAPPERVFKAFTDPEDLQVWFPSGAPEGSAMTRCESDAVEGGRYHYVMVVPGHGSMAWHGLYTNVNRPGTLGANEWFTMGETEPTGPPAVQMLTFEAAGDGFTSMTMRVDLSEPEDPETFMEQSAAGLSSSLATLDDLVSS